MSAVAPAATATVRANRYLLDDPLLPHRDDLLDPGTVAPILAGVAGVDAGHVRAEAPVSVKYRWAESLRVVHRVHVDGRPHLVAARMFASADLATAAWRAAAAAVPGVALDAGRNTVWFTYPHDRRLRGLGELDAPPADLADLPSGRWVTSDLVQYAPERSATFRAKDALGATAGFVKLYRAGHEAADLARLYASIAAKLGRSADGFATPRVLAVDAERGVLVLEPMPGLAWNEVPLVRQETALSVVGAGLRRLHDLGRQHDVGQVGRPPFARLRADKLTSAASLIAAACPGVAREVLRLGARLAATAPPPSADVLLHGDLHPKNVLVDAAAVSLIDLDQAAAGAPAADLGSLVARLRYGTLLGETDPDDERRLSAAFLDGYGASGDGRPDGSRVADLHWHTAAALLAERALRALTRIHAGGLAALADTIDAAHRSLDDAGIR